MLVTCEDGGGAFCAAIAPLGCTLSGERMGRELKTMNEVRDIYFHGIPILNPHTLYDPMMRRFVIGKPNSKRLAFFLRSRALLVCSSAWWYLTVATFSGTKVLEISVASHMLKDVG